MPYSVQPPQLPIVYITSSKPLPASVDIQDVIRDPSEFSRSVPPLRHSPLGWKPVYSTIAPPESSSQEAIKRKSSIVIPSTDAKLLGQPRMVGYWPKASQPSLPDNATTINFSVGTAPSPQESLLLGERVATVASVSQPSLIQANSSVLSAKPKQAIDLASQTPILELSQAAPVNPEDAGGKPSSRVSVPLPADFSGLVELKADRQEFDNENQVLTAQGKVWMRFRGSILQSDYLKANLRNRLIFAEGNVTLTRGSQVLQGDRFEYDLVQESGVVNNARGEIFLPSSQEDFTISSPITPLTGILQPPINPSASTDQSLQAVSSPGGILVDLGAGRNTPDPVQGGTVRRFRFEADQITFTATAWFGKNVRITNDPFSPPQLEIRADEARYTVLSSELQLIETSSPRLVFDQSFSLPIPRSRVLLRESELEQALVNIGIDGRDRDGVFVERGFKIFSGEKFDFWLTPQILVQRGLDQGFDNIADSVGLVATLDGQLSPRTSLRGFASFGGLDLSNVENRLRASLRLRQLIGTHSLALEGSYRDRLFNGSLGFQDVQVSVGALFASPNIPLGKSGFVLSYQAGAQYIAADTDRVDLLPLQRANNRVGLGRLQSSANLSRGFVLWQGQPLPATPDQGLRYTPNPVVPSLRLNTGITGITSFYTTGDNQSTLTGSVSLHAELGNFSRSFLDYTSINIGYAQTIQSGLSPFLFDRSVDNRVLSGGIVQQIYGPIRFGIQTAINLDTSRQISTDYTLEYSRRAYGIILRYNPVLELGSISLRISDFNWTGRTEPFSGK